MFSFALTPLGHLFFGLSVLVFVSLALVKNSQRDVLLHTLLLASLGMIFYAADLVTLFVGWEIMGWSAFFLIARRADSSTLQKYIIFNLAAAFTLLGAIVLIYAGSGSVAYAQIDFGKITSSQTTIISILVLITVFIKSGVIPFHYWVVDAYSHSGDLFSAILSAIISKAGIFLFILLFFQLITARHLPDYLFNIVAWLGVITSIIATFKAIDEDEAKRLLAYSSIAQVGYIVTILAVVGSLSFTAALYHTVIHTLVKLLLFVNIAAIIHVTGQGAFSRLGGLMDRYILNFILLVIGIIALAGIPLLGGFNSKFIIYTSLLEEHRALLLTAVMFSSASAFLYCYKLVYGIYLGQPTARKANTPSPRIPVSFYIPQLLGGGILVALGMLPGAIIPFFNIIAKSLGFAPVTPLGIFALGDAFAAFNGGMIWVAFGGIFVVILLIFLLLRNRSVAPRDRLDISYSGEIPRADVNLHYGYGMGRELSRIGGIGLILRHHAHALWGRVETITADASHLARQLYTITAQNTAWLIVAFFTILLYLEVY
jgi:NADH-quinone oxidoreductase subunit M